MILSIANDLKSGDLAGARHLLEQLLNRASPQELRSFRQLADRIAVETEAPGWATLNSSGTVTVAAIGGKRNRQLVVCLDDTPLKLPAGSTSDGLQIFMLPTGWRTARSLALTRSGAPFIGSPIDIQRLIRTEGFVEIADDGGLQGWAWHPADPAAVPVLRLAFRDLAGGRPSSLRITVDDDTLVPVDVRDLDRRRGFTVAPGRLPAVAEINVTGPDGRNLAGSPILLGGERLAARQAAHRIGLCYPVAPSDSKSSHGSTDAWRPLPATLLTEASRRHRSERIAPRIRPALDVVIPVFRGAEDFTACLASLQGQLPAQARIVVVDDGSEDAPLRAAVDVAVASGAIILLRHSANRGFPAAVRTGLRHGLANGPRDIVLLNSDTLLPPRAIRRLVDIAYSHADIGSVTPMTNDGTIVSYPSPERAVEAPDPAALRILDAAFAASNAAGAIDLPTGVGFCMLIRHDCLAKVGGFRDDMFAQGYGEENDWCLRASHLGWRHVVATGVFVAHSGGASFGAMKAHLIARNVKLLNRLHPGYDALVADFQARDPLAPARRAVDLHRWRSHQKRPGAVLLITHDMGGGVARHIDERCAAIRALGLRSIILRPAEAGACRISDTPDPDGLSLEFALPAQLDALLALLREDRVAAAELHHFIGYGMEIVEIIQALDIPFDVYGHDFAYWCPRVTMVGDGGHYCGEPTEVAECEACIGRHGSRLLDPIGVAALRARSARWLREARQVILPSRDAAARMRRHFPFSNPVVTPWEDDAALSREVPQRQQALRPDQRRLLRVLVPGAIGLDKGYDVLLACARDAAERNLPLEFVVAGFTMEDGDLLETGHVFVTGKFEEEEGAALVAEQHADLGFIPSVWPETWCYALSLLWRSGLRVVSFDLGAQAERIRQTGRGTVFPLGLPPPRVNDLLLQLGQI